MASHRIKKYFRQIVCQDFVLSCQTNNVQEIPLIDRAQITCLSLRNKRALVGGERSAWPRKDLDLSGMLVCWHLLNSRGMPALTKRERTENVRRTITKTGEKVSNNPSSHKLRLYTTLRNDALYTAIEKYLLFLMPREMRKETTVYLSDKPYSRRDRICLSTLYVHTALNLCHYKINDWCLQEISSSNKKALSSSNAERGGSLPSLALSPERISFPLHDVSRSEGVRNQLAPFAPALRVQKQIFCKTWRIRFGLPRLVKSKKLSLHCPSLLNSPDIQDIAQSGLATLEGSFTLEVV